MRARSTGGSLRPAHSLRNNSGATISTLPPSSARRSQKALPGSCSERRMHLALGIASPERAGRRRAGEDDEQQRRRIGFIFRLLCSVGEAREDLVRGMELRAAVPVPRKIPAASSTRVTFGVENLNPWRAAKRRQAHEQKTGRFGGAGNDRQTRLECDECTRTRGADTRVCRVETLLDASRAARNKRVETSLVLASEPGRHECPRHIRPQCQCEVILARFVRR